MRDGRVLRRGVLFAFLAWAGVGCASAPGNELYSAGAVTFQTVCVFPLDAVVEVPTDLVRSADRVEAALHDYLTERGKSIETIGFSDARNAWLASMSECRSRAEQGCDGFDGAAGVLARRLRDDRDYEVLLVPYLLFHTAKVHIRNAEWDGVVRQLEIDGTSPFGPVQLDSITMQAPSLAVFAFSNSGEKLFTGVGGLDLAHRLLLIADPGPGHNVQVRALDFVLREDLFADAALLREGVAVALDPLLPISDVDPD